ncbi:MAG: Gfo/Idh/MocA family oxidoreductase [Candidatus Latescibacteria bacterium]|nr:Gfo/Idh/MocA family oxidoreductase [Candidatus Latescibacterota bacterium]
MSREIGFAVVGLGMGRHHCKAIQAAPGARLVAVCDLDEERLRPTAQEYGCRAYATVEELLGDDQVEVVNIATPSGTHAAIGSRFAAAGKHLIVEKPADILAGRIEELLAAVSKHGVKAAGIFQSRLDPLNIRIRHCIQQGRLGSLIGAHGHLPWYRAQSYYEGRHGSWKGTWDLDGGGSLMNQGVHTVDLLQWLVGPVAAVMGGFGVFGHRIEAEDQTVALLRFANGALGTLYTTTCCYPGFNQRLTLYGTRGTIIKEEGSLHSWKMQDDPEGREEQELLALYGAGRKASGAADPMAVGFDGHTQIVVDMIGAILEGRQPLITLESARHAVEIINAIYLAGRTGREVRVGEQLAPAPTAQKPAAQKAKAKAKTKTKPKAKGAQKTGKSRPAPKQKKTASRPAAKAKKPAAKKAKRR